MSLLKAIEIEIVFFLSPWESKRLHIQSGHKPGKHRKPGKLREFEKIIKISEKTHEKSNLCGKKH